MISIIRMVERHPGFDRSSAVYELTCSELADISKLPTSKTAESPWNTTYPHPGSTCFCTEDSSAYILGADDEWHSI